MDERDLDFNGWSDEDWAANVAYRKDLARLGGWEYKEMKRPAEIMTGSKIMVMGDTHGDTNAYIKVLDIAASRDITKVFQMGDCGLFPVYASTVLHNDLVAEHSRKLGIKNYWIRGNHDDPDEWQHVIDAGTYNGWGMLRSNIFLAPRVHYFKHNGIKFLGVGGAVSIDKDWRLKAEKKAGTLWWPNEIISPEDVDAVEDRKIQVLMTHDCSNYTPFWGRMKADMDSESNRRRLDEIIKRSRPDAHFHGHMHTQYEWENYLVHEANHATMTYGLECNPGAMQTPYTGNNWLIFDTDDFSVEWGSPEHVYNQTTEQVGK